MSQEIPRPQIINTDGSYNEQALNRYGITEALAGKIVTYRRGGEVYSVTVAQAFDEPTCPLADIVAQQHDEDPVNGTRRAFEGLKLLGVKLNISPEDLAGKKNQWFRGEGQ